MWRHREIENYLCQEVTLLNWVKAQGRAPHGDLFVASWLDAMEKAIAEICSALADLGKPDPWSPDLKASDEFLDPLFKKFYQTVRLPNLMQKTDYHTLAPYVPPDELNAEVREKLDAIVDVAGKAVVKDGS